MKFSIKGFFSKYDQIRSFLQIWSHLLKKYLMENLIFLCSITNKRSTENLSVLNRVQPVFPSYRIQSTTLQIS